MSRQGVNSTPIKQEISPFRKDNRGPNSTPNSNNNNANMNANKRNSGNFNQRPQGNQNQGNQNQGGNRNQGPQNQGGNRNQTPQNQNRNQGGQNQGQGGNKNQQTPQNKGGPTNRPGQGQGGQNTGNKPQQGQNKPPGQGQNKPQGSGPNATKGQSNQNVKEQETKNVDKKTHEADSKEDEKTTEVGEKKFTGRCRLFVGNLTSDVTENDFRKLFEQYGEISEVYVNQSRGFGFIRLDYRHNAEAAKAALDGFQRKGRQLRVRFATHGAALKVKNLHPYVSNELLEQSFQQFGDLERCIVIVDDRGKPTGEGIVEYVRKPGANSALRRINEGVFLMGADPKPVAVEPLEQKDEEDGMPEKFITKTDQYKKEREKEPRFAMPGTFEYEFGTRWKQLEDLEKKRIEQVKKDTEEARMKLEDEMQNALYDYQAEKIRQDLLRQQEELRRLEELRNQGRARRQQEMDLRNERSQEERRATDMFLSRRQQEIAARMDRNPMDARGPMDGPGPGPMRNRDGMMMQERFGDRMNDSMLNRGPDQPRMGDRMPGDRMPGDRMPDQRMGDRMPERMQGERMQGDRMSERMGERMPDQRMPDQRMSDQRMSDQRMSDQRMGGDRGMGPGGGDRGMGPGGPGQSGPGGLSWDEKQQREAGMRGEGRGRDMRGPGPGPQSSLQPPPVPPEVLERGAPVVAAAAIAAAAVAQGLKGQPKPLMQGGPGGPGFGGQGGPGGPNQQDGVGNDSAQMKRRLETGPGGNDSGFTNQRGVLGAPPGALGGNRGMGPNAGMGGQMRGGQGNMGGSSPNMFPGQGNMDERMMMERRRQAAAREELSEIKRMRRF